MTTPVTLKSGAKVVFRSADLKPNRALFKAVARELIKVDIKLESVDLNKLFNLPADVLIKALLLVVSSDAVEAALWPCMEACTYNDEKMTQALFDNDDTKFDYLPCALEVALCNLRPIFENLALPSLSQPDPKAASPK